MSKKKKENGGVRSVGKEGNAWKKPVQPKKEKPERRMVPKLSPEAEEKIRQAYGDQASAAEPEEREYSDKWDTEQRGDVLVGEVSRIQNGQFGLMVFLTDNDGKQWLLPNRAALSSEPLIQKAKLGDRLCLVCLGEEVNTRNQRTFIAYDVRRIEGGVPF